MRTQPRIPIVLLGALLALAACDNSATAPDEARMSAEEATLLASEFNLLSESVFGGIAASFSAGAAPMDADAVPIEVEFSRTTACPKGGSVAVRGQTTGSLDRETRTLVLETTSTQIHDDCAFQGRQGAMITVDGDPSIAVKASTKLVNGQPSGLQTLTQKGALTWTRSTGGSGKCTVDLATEWNPETRTRTVRGTFCNQTISATRTRG